ncbi:MAG: RHS repeat domain-containing protein [Candidatus Thiodiazotropha sp.]
MADYRYDDARRVTQVSNRLNGAVASRYDYTYDRNGNRLSQQESNGGGVETTTYVYDNNDRLTRADYPDATLDYGYDAVYNRTSETAVEKVGGTTVSSKTFSYNNRNQVTSISDSANAANDTTYSYDANGNQTVKTRNGHTLTFVYDVRDQLVRVSQDTTTLGRFRYDHAGMRIQKEGAQGIVRYTYDDGSVLLQTDDTGATLAKYDYGPDRLLSLEQATEGEQFYHFDALGSVVNLSRPDGSLQARYQYDAWGNERTTTGSSWNRFAFTGHEKDEETGLYYFKARFYDPQLGRFLSQDAYLGETNTPPSLHRYLYAYANPTVWIDLTGYQSEVPCFGSGCAPSLTEEEQIQRESERQALLDKKPTKSPLEVMEEQRREQAKYEEIYRESEREPGTESTDRSDSESSSDPLDISGQQQVQRQKNLKEMLGRGERVLQENTPDIDKVTQTLKEEGIIASIVVGTKEAARVLKHPFVKAYEKFSKKFRDKGDVAKGGPKLLEAPRDVLLRNTQDPRLKDAINNLYRPGAKVGSGSTADVVRFERATGELLSPKGHTKKLLDRRTQLMKLRKDPNLSSGDRRIIHDILKDTQDALSN